MGLTIQAREGFRKDAEQNLKTRGPFSQRAPSQTAPGCRAATARERYGNCENALLSRVINESNNNRASHVYWLNLVERWFAAITEKRIRRGSRVLASNLFQNAPWTTEQF